RQPPRRAAQPAADGRADGRLYDDQPLDHRPADRDRTPLAQAFASAAFTYSGLSGARRMRTPVASKNAFATAAGITRMVGSPAPEGATSGRSISVTSMDSGASGISRIG